MSKMMFTLPGVFDEVALEVSVFTRVNFRKSRQREQNHRFWRVAADVHVRTYGRTDGRTDALIPSELSTLTSTYENIYTERERERDR